MGWLKRRIIEELEPTMAEWERRWIPIDEALPDRNVNVLVYIPVSEEKTMTRFCCKAWLGLFTQEVES